MFKKTRSKLRSTIADVKAAFSLFISTVRDNTDALQSLAAEQKLLRDKLDTLVGHSSFLVTAKKAELSRAGHRVD